MKPQIPSTQGKALWVRLEPTEIEIRPSKKQRAVKLLFSFLLGSALFLLFTNLLPCASNKKSEAETDRLPARLEFEKRFEVFLERYGKSYSADEKYQRFRIYVQNVLEYEAEERRSPLMDYDDTPFTDWTDSELQAFLSKADIPIPKNESRYEEPEDPSFLRPSYVNWTEKGKVTRVKDQKQCGSCWAFAVVAAVESQYSIANDEEMELSEQQLIDCDDQDSGCHGGYRPYAMKYVELNGLYSEEDYPYAGEEEDRCRHLGKKKVYIDDYKILTNDEERTAGWVAKNGPVTFGMEVVKKMTNYRDGIFHPSKEECEERSLGSHAMAIVGYGSEEGRDYWLVKNSWGRHWGQRGYLKLARGVNACGAAEYVVAPIID